MKIGLISFLLVALLSTIAGAIFYFSTRYNSAFEADQACHSEKSIGYIENSRVDCDHDLETRQWILYEQGINGKAANVLERFRY